MPVTVRRFLGRDLTLPEDRSYFASEGLWVRKVGDRIEVGLTEPAVLMAGGVRQVEPLVEQGAGVEAGQTVCLVLTAKLKYLASPASGTISFPPVGSEVAEDPYGSPLFTLNPGGSERPALTDAEGYAKVLAHSEGAHNPEGRTGGTSSICKAVYTGLREQRLGESHKS